MRAKWRPGRLGSVLFLAILFTSGTVVVAGAGCGSAVRHSLVDPGDAIIWIDSKISSAVVVINDREVGTVGSLRRGIALSPGTHRLEVRHPQYHSHYSVLVLRTRERRTIRVALAARLL